LEILTWVHYQILPEPKETVQEVCFFCFIIVKQLCIELNGVFGAKVLEKKNGSLCVAFLSTFYMHW